MPARAAPKFYPSPPKPNFGTGESVLTAISPFLSKTRKESQDSTVEFVESCNQSPKIRRKCWDTKERAERDQSPLRISTRPPSIRASRCTMSLIAAAGIALATTTGTGNLAGLVGYELIVRGKAKYHFVTANIKSGRIAASTVHAPKLISVKDLLRPAKPVAAITGTFFNLQSQRPVADVLVDGTLVSRGSRGSAIGVNYFGDVDIFHDRYLKKTDWAEYQFGLRGTVRVIEKGRVCPDPKAQRFKDKRIWGRAARTAIGKTRNGKLVLVATRSQVTLSELGKTMKSKGVVDGVSLDGGGSTCLYYQGSYIIPPQRKLCNLFVLTRRDVLEPIVASQGQ